MRGWPRVPHRMGCSPPGPCARQPGSLVTRFTLPGLLADQLPGWVQSCGCRRLSFFSHFHCSWRGEGPLPGLGTGAQAWAHPCCPPRPPPAWGRQDLEGSPMFPTWRRWACRRVCQGPMSPHPPVPGVSAPLSHPSPSHGLSPCALPRVFHPQPAGLGPERAQPLAKPHSHPGQQSAPPGSSWQGSQRQGAGGRLVEMAPGNRPWWHGPQIVESSQRGDAGTPGSAASGERD